MILMTCSVFGACFQNKKNVFIKILQKTLDKNISGVYTFAGLGYSQRDDHTT